MARRGSQEIKQLWDVKHILQKEENIMVIEGLQAGASIPKDVQTFLKFRVQRFTRKLAFATRWLHSACNHLATLTMHGQPVLA